MDKLDIFKTPIYYSEYTFDNLRRVRSYVKDLEGKNVTRNLKQKHGKILYVDRYKYMPSDLLNFISYLKECILKLKSDLYKHGGNRFISKADNSWLTAFIVSKGSGSNSEHSKIDKKNSCGCLYLRYTVLAAKSA